MAVCGVDVRLYVIPVVVFLDGVLFGEGVDLGVSSVGNHGLFFCVYGLFNFVVGVGGLQGRVLRGPAISVWVGVMTRGAKVEGGEIVFDDGAYWVQGCRRLVAVGEIARV